MYLHTHIRRCLVPPRLPISRSAGRAVWRPLYPQPRCRVGVRFPTTSKGFFLHARTDILASASDIPSRLAIGQPISQPSRLPHPPLAAGISPRTVGFSLRSTHSPPAPPGGNPVGRSTRQRRCIRALYPGFRGLTCISVTTAPG